MGIFRKISNALKKTRESFAKKIDLILSHGELDDDFFEELTDILVSSDVGASCSERIVEELRKYARVNKLRKSQDVKQGLKVVLNNILSQVDSVEFAYPCIITIIGVNGVGKTTTIGKLTSYFKKLKKDVTLVAGDTFRAAATDQLTEWANRNKAKIIKQNEGADAAAVVFDGVTSARAKNTDVLIIDTAGRLHTKTNLMEELRKIDKVINKEYPQAHRYNFIVLDATTGQNALSQINHFNEYMQLDGIILTKLDGTAKGGVVFPIAEDLRLPVVFVGTGEQIDDIEVFDSTEFVDNMF